MMGYDYSSHPIPVGNYLSKAIVQIKSFFSARPRRGAWHLVSTLDTDLFEVAATIRVVD